MKNLYLIILFSVLSVCQSQGQQTQPHISGRMYVSMKDGLIRCNFTISQIPDLGKQYKLLLYRGFNIGLLKNDTGRVLKYSGYYDDKLHGEAAAYVPYLDNDTLKSPKLLNVSYTGAFPVYTDTLNAFDFKGLIAFNGKTLRATEQSKWYPVIYDVKNDKELPDVSYDITVDCPDCKVVYLNGSQPQAGPKVRLTSATPRPLLLFTGDYEVQALSSSTFLNAGMTDEEANVFNRNVSAVTGFYARYLQRPYGEKITFLQHKSIEPFTPKRSWGFVTFPTIAVAGGRFKAQVDVKTGMFRDTGSYRFYAHELGHYYFGQVLQPNSTLRWFFLESMAEFLSIKATEAKYGKAATEGFIAIRKSYEKDWKIKPLPQVTNQESIGESYRYHYAPLILLAMEKRFGSEKVRRFCQQSLKYVGEPTDYGFLVKRVKEAGIADKDWKLFEEQVINQQECKRIFDYL